MSYLKNVYLNKENLSFSEKIQLRTVKWYQLKKKFKKFIYISTHSLLAFIMILCGFLMYFSYSFFSMKKEELAILEQKLESYEKSENEKNIFIHALAKIIQLDGRVDNNLSKIYAEHILNNAIRYKIDPLLILSVMSVESNFNYKAVSEGNAVGLMQVIYYWHKEKVTSREHLFDPFKNIQVGSQILREYLDRSKTETEMLLRYNGSLGQAPIYAMKVQNRKNLYNDKINVFLSNPKMLQDEINLEKQLKETELKKQLLKKDIALAKNNINSNSNVSNGKEKQKIVVQKSEDKNGFVKIQYKTKNIKKNNKKENKKIIKDFMKNT